MRGLTVGEYVIRNVRLPMELWAKYTEHADRLLYRSVGHLVTEALTEYERLVLSKMDHVDVPEATW